MAASAQTQEISVVRQAKGFFWVFSINLPRWSNIMSHLLTKSIFNISCYSSWSTQPFHLYCGLWISHVIMTHFVYMNTQKWLDISSERKSWYDFYFSVESTFQESVSKQNFYACARAKKAMSPRHSAYISSSVKSPLRYIFKKTLLNTL